MKIKIIKNQKGITLITLAITVVLMLIVMGCLVYNATTGVNLRKLNRMNNDIETLEDKVNNYYARYSAIPIKRDTDGNALDISSVVISAIPKSSRDANDNDVYYILELSNLKGVSLNYGKDYSKIKTASDVTKDSDVYIINEQSHKIYYLSGIKFEGTVYYTNDIDEVAIN